MLKNPQLPIPNTSSRSATAPVTRCTGGMYAVG